MSTELRISYKVPTDIVKLKVVIGDEQIGSSVVRLNGDLLQMGDIDNLELGLGLDIREKILTIKSIVADVNDRTNHTSITYKLYGGQEDESHTLQETVPNDGDSIVYRAEISFE
jgi:hypothetical protein